MSPLNSHPIPYNFLLIILSTCFVFIQTPVFIVPKYAMCNTQQMKPFILHIIFLPFNRKHSQQRFCQMYLYIEAIIISSFLHQCVLVKLHHFINYIANKFQDSSIIIFYWQPENSYPHCHILYCVWSRMKFWIPLLHRQVMIIYNLWPIHKSNIFIIFMRESNQKIVIA